MGFLQTFFKNWAFEPAMEPVVEPLVDIKEKTLDEIRAEERALAQEYFNHITVKKNEWKRNPVSYDLFVMLGESNLRIEEELRSLLRSAGHKDADVEFHRDTHSNGHLLADLNMTYGDLYK